MGKRLKDIRFYESDVANIAGNTLPAEVGVLFPFGKNSHAAGQRIARKLHELGFEAGDFDHLYLNLSTCEQVQHIALSPRIPVSGIRYVDVPLEPSNIPQHDAAAQDRFIAQRTFEVLSHLSQNKTAQLQLIQHVKALYDKQGSELMIQAFQKSTKSYSVTISYQIRPHQARVSKAFIHYQNLKTGVQFQQLLVELTSYEDIYALVGRIAVKGKSIVIHPKNSFRAGLHTASYPTPIKVAIP